MIYTTCYVVWNKKHNQIISDVVYIDKDAIEPITKDEPDLEIRELKLALEFGHSDMKVEQEAILDFIVHNVMKE